MNIINGFGMWIACSVMIIVLLVQSILYYRLGKKEAQTLGIAKETQTQSVRAAAITAIGPTLSMAIVLLSLVAVVGSPMAWMRLSDIGAARTEIAVVSLSGSILPEGASDVTTFTYASWGMALNNMGWMLVALIFTSRMGWAVNKMNAKFNPKAVKMVMTGASIGLFAYLLSNVLVRKAGTQWVAALAAGLSIIVINKVFGKNQRLQELALGIAMIIGMVAGSVFASVTAA